MLQARTSPITGARWFVWALLLSSCAADNEGDGTRAQPVRSDSAGVEIVSNVQPLWSGTDGWRIADEPDLRIGHLEGTAEDVLHGVIAVRDLGNTILVAQQTEVRLYRRDGSFITR